MNALIAGVMLAAGMANGGHRGLAGESMAADTAIIASADTLPSVPLGTQQSATLIRFRRVIPARDSAAQLDTTLSAPASPRDSGVVAPSADTTLRTSRPRAIEYSEAYHTRLKIHQIGAYAMLPLFISEYIIGQKLLTSTNRSNGLKTSHSVIAAAVGVVFVSNTITGAWNFLDARKDPNGRARREIHSILMLASDVGFVATAISAGNAKFSIADARRHRTIAISSIALSAVGTGMMWLWRD